MGAGKKLDPKVAEAVMLKAGLKPLEPYKGANSEWKCLHISCGNTIYPTYNNVRQGRGACRPCGYVKTGNARRMREKKAVAIMLKAGFKPLEDYKDSKTGIRCIHLKCGNEIQPRLNKIMAGGGCGYCARKFKRNPEESTKIMLEAGFEVQEPYRRADVGWKSKCLKCSRIVYPRLNGIEKGKGCKYCHKRFVDPDEAFEFMKSRNLLPYSRYTTANSRWECKCLICGEDVSPTYSSIRDGQGCASCAGNQIRPEDAVSVMIKANLKPLEPYLNGQKNWKCQCLKCGEVVHPTYSAVQQGQGGCIYCAEKGFDPKKPSYLYLLTNKELNSYKVGISNSHLKNNDRIKVFKASGWIVHKKWQFENGIDAWKSEKQVFKIVRKELKIPQHLSKKEMGYGHGHTETINADSISLLQLEKIIKKVIKEMKE